MAAAACGPCMFLFTPEKEVKGETPKTLGPRAQTRSCKLHILHQCKPQLDCVKEVQYHSSIASPKLGMGLGAFALCSITGTGPCTAQGGDVHCRHIPSTTCKLRSTNYERHN